MKKHIYSRQNKDYKGIEVKIIKSESDSATLRFYDAFYMSLTNSRGSRVAGPKSRVAGPKSRSRVQCRGRGSKVAVAGPMSRQGKIIWGSR